MDISFTNTRESVAQAPTPDTDWSSLSRAERIRSIELEGYVLIPDLLSPELLEGIRGGDGRTADHFGGLQRVPAGLCQRAVD